MTVGRDGGAGAGGQRRRGAGAGGQRRRKRRALRAALGAMVAASALPYGYTVALWSSGALLEGVHGIPSVGAVMGFAAGALTGFGTMGLLARGALAPSEASDEVGHRVLAGVLHWVSVGVAVGAVALLAHVPGWAAWPLGSFAATCAYIGCAGVQLALVAGWGAGPPAR